MSGGTLTDYGSTSLYAILEWARQIEPENPLFAELLRDEYLLLEKYDYYLSGDTSEDRVEEAWKEFSDRWLGDVSKAAEAVLKRVFDGMRKGVRDGHRAEL